MCLTTIRRWGDVASAEISSPNTLSSDMKVYKVLKVTTKNRKKTYSSPYRHFPYEKGIHYYQTKDWYTTSIRADLYGSVYMEINQGLHAYVNPHFAGFISNNQVIVEMIIPAGAKYYLGNAGDIVANQLIWK